MAKRNFEIWDNHWKDSPVWTFLLLLFSVLSIMALSFQGGLLLLKGDFVLASICSALVGIGVYALIYRVIQMRTSSDVKSNARGAIAAAMLVIPYAGFVFLGGAALCNEFSFRPSQQQEFSEIEQRATEALNRINSDYLNVSLEVNQALQNQCQECSGLSSSSRRARRAEELSLCFASGLALDCKDGGANLLSRLQEDMQGRFSTKPNSQINIERLLARMNDDRFSSRLYQYAIQAESGELDSLFRSLQTHHAQQIAGFQCLDLGSRPNIGSMGTPELDCSDWYLLFCEGWGPKVAGILFLLMGMSLFPLYLADFSERLAPQSGSGGGDISIEI
jgi:hypothetical protein